MRLLLSALVGLVIVGVVLVGLEAMTVRSEERRFPPPGTFIDGSSGRLHIQCAGEESAPLVILEAGAGASSLDWATMFDALGDDLRVCAYDRAGFGWSPRGPRPRDFTALEADFDAFVDGVSEDEAFVLAGHSFGGLLVQAYAARQPERVQGLVLVDALDAVLAEEMAQTNGGSVAYVRAGAVATVFGVPRRLGLVPQPAGTPAEVAGAMKARTLTRSTMLTAADESEGLMSVVDAVRNRPSLSGDFPVAVISRKPSEGGGAFEDQWAAAQARLAELTDATTHQVAPSSNHHVQFSSPDLVADAIRKMTR
ncbi:MAG: alpha/beta hydrolase [Pseudomonadota bacterium]